MEIIIREIKRKKTINLIISIIVIIICLINFFINMNSYYAILNKNYKIINSISDITDKDKYYYIDMNNTTKSNYNLKGDDITANIYFKEIDNKKILIILNESTSLTNKTIVQVMNDDIILQLKNKFQKSDYKHILTDVNYNDEIKIDLFKIYFLLFVIVLAILSILINMVGIINPKTTKMYKKYQKNNL